MRSICALAVAAFVLAAVPMAGAAPGSTSLPPTTNMFGTSLAGSSPIT